MTHDLDDFASLTELIRQIDAAPDSDVNGRDVATSLGKPEADVEHNVRRLKNRGIIDWARHATSTCVPLVPPCRNTREIGRARTAQTSDRACSDRAVSTSVSRTGRGCHPSVAFAFALLMIGACAGSAPSLLSSVSEVGTRAASSPSS